MQLSKTHMQYVLTQFNAGVEPPQILERLQYRAFLPSINVATIRRCIRDNGRVLTDEQTGNATQGNQSIGIGQASHPLPPANQGTPGPSAATKEFNFLKALLWQVFQPPSTTSILFPRIHGTLRQTTLPSPNIELGSRERRSGRRFEALDTISLDRGLWIAWFGKVY